MVMIKISCEKGWMFNETTQRLEKWVAEKCEFTLGGSLVTYHGTLGGKPFSVSSEGLRVFNNPKDFEAGKVAVGMFDNVYGSYLFKRYVPVKVKVDNEGNETFHAHIFKDGQAVYANVTGMVCEYNFSKQVFRTDIKCYASEKSVYEYNDFQILNEDGTTTTKKSLKTRLAFNDEQKALIDKLGGLLDKLKGSGVVIVYDRDYETLCAFKDNVKLKDMDNTLEEDGEVCVNHMAHKIRDVNTIDDYHGAVIKIDE